MQETVDALSSKNTQLLAEKAMGEWISAGVQNSWNQKHMPATPKDIITVASTGLTKSPCGYDR